MEFTSPPPAWLPESPNIQRILEGFIISLRTAEAMALEELVVQALDADLGVWISRSASSAEGPVQLLEVQMGLSKLIPRGQIWDLSAIGGIENLRYFDTRTATERVTRPG